MSDSAIREAPGTAKPQGEAGDGLVLKASPRRLVVLYQLQFLANIISGLVVTPMVIRAAGGEAYGAWLFVLPVVGYLSVLQAGLPTAVLRQVAETESRRDRNATLATVQCAQGLFLGIALLVAAAGAVAWYATPGLNTVRGTRVLGFSVFWWALAQTVLGIGFGALGPALTGFGRGVSVTTLAVAAAIASSVAAAGLAAGRTGLLAAVAAGFIAASVNAAGVLWLACREFGCRVLRARWDSALTKTLTRVAGALMVDAVVVQLVFHTDDVVVGSVLGTGAVSTLAMTRKLPELAQGLLWRVIDGHLPRMAALAGTNKRSELREEILSAQMAALGLASGAAGVFIAATEPFLALWVGPGYYAGGFVTALLAWSFLAYVWLHGVGAVLVSIGEVQALMRMSMLEGIGNVVLSLALVKQVGLPGVLLGTALAGIPTLVVLTLKVGNAMDGEPLRFGAWALRHGAFALTTAGVAGMCGQLARSMAGTDSLAWSLAISVAASGTIGLCAVAAVPVFRAAVMKVFWGRRHGTESGTSNG